MILSLYFFAKILIFLQSGTFPIKLGTRKKSLEIYPSHITSVEHVEEFIQFLKHCGGFEVW